MIQAKGPVQTHKGVVGQCWVEGSAKQSPYFLPKQHVGSTPKCQELSMPAVSLGLWGPDRETNPPAPTTPSCSQYTPWRVPSTSGKRETEGRVNKGNA